MTVHDRHTTRTAQALVGAQRKAKFGLEAPGLTNLSQRMVVFNATFQDIEALLPRARQSMGGGASNEVVHRVARHNPDSTARKIDSVTCSTNIFTATSAPASEHRIKPAGPASSRS